MITRYPVKTTIVGDDGGSCDSRGILGWINPEESPLDLAGRFESARARGLRVFAPSGVLVWAVLALLFVFLPAGSSVRLVFGAGAAWVAQGLAAVALLRA